MTTDFNAAGSLNTDDRFDATGLSASPNGQDVLGRLIDASSKIPGLTCVSPENLEVLEHLGKGRDLIITGPDRLASITCAALPAIAGCGLILVVAPSMNSIRRMKTRFEGLNIITESFDLAPSKVEKRGIWAAMDHGSVQILLVTPGRLASQRFRERLRRRNISAVIIDQAHLMSPWSHRFLPSYRFAGAFLSSLNSGGQSPQKIAILWNPNGRMTLDLSKLLSMRTPYQGRLVADALPGIGVESKPASTDADRQKIIRQELERSGGQGVIYCGTITQLFSAAELLKASGEDFAVIRPGMDDFQTAKIKQQFEAGKLRVVAVIGPFLSDIESAQGLDFVVFNGMPDSAETMARELFGVEDAGFIRSVVIVGEKDYFQQRFLIDKNYPDTLVMRACVLGVRDVFGSKSAVTPETLVTHVKMATPFPADDVDHCLQVLFREGLLENVIDQDTGTMYVALRLTQEEEANFWHEYPLRKIDHVARLDKMRDFASKDGDRARHLQSLIRQ
ncbi:MAG: DEAD/DEAH box helicase [Pseudomonadota bacterium]